MAGTEPAQLSLRQRLKFLAKDTALYGGAKALSLAVGFITFPVIARHFSVADYGLIDLLSTVGAFLATVIVFGQDSAIGRYFYEYTATQERRALISQSLLIQVVVCVAVCILALAGAPWVISMLGEGSRDDLSLLMLLVILQVPFNVFLGFAQNLLKWSFARTEFLVISLGSTLASAGAIVGGILLFDFGIVEVFYTYLIIRLLFGCLGLHYCRKWVVRPRNLGYAREMLPFALFFGVICVIASFIPLMERSIVSSFLGPDDLGLYAVGAKVAMLISLPIAAFQTAWGPFSLAIHKELNAGATYGTVLKLFTMLLSVLVLGLTMLSQPMIELLASNRYVGAAIVVLPIALGLMIQGVCWITEIGIGIAKKAKIQLYIYLLYLVCTGVAILVLAKVFGLAGVAWGTLIGYAVKSIASSYMAQRVYPLPWPFLQTIVLVVAATVLGVIGGLLQGHLNIASSIGMMVAAISCLVVLSWFYLLNQHERVAAKRLVSKWLCKGLHLNRVRG